MRVAIICLLLVSCVPTIERVERHDATITDSALSVLGTIGKDTVPPVQVKTIEKTLVKYVQSEPIRVAMVRPSPLVRRGCDTVWIRDTIYLDR